MNFDCIIANPPYAKIGCDIVNKIIYDVPHKDISILGTRAMLGKHNEHLALEYAYIEDFILKPVTKCKWVQQIILLGHRGSCRVIPSKVMEGHRAEIKPNELRIPFTRVGAGIIHGQLDNLLTRNRAASLIISVSNEDYAYLKYHWDGMNIIERFWWLHDHGMYKRFIEQ